MVLAGINSVTFLWVSLAGFLLFFEARMGSSNAGPFNTPDLAAAAFALHALLSRRSLSFRLPMSGLLLVLYAFLAYVLALSVGPAFQYGPLDNWYLRDLKCIFWLSLAVLLCRDKRLGPRNLTLLLLGIVLLTSAHAVYCLASWLAHPARVGTWNEIFLSDAVGLAVVLLAVPQLRTWRPALAAGLVLCILGLLVTETRGVWLGTAASLAVYAAVLVSGADRVRLARIGRGVATAALIAVALILLLRTTLGFDPVGRVAGRFSQAGSVVELADPSSSLGYRLHESAVVWEKRSWVGHGTGSRLRLFFTQMDKSKVMDWWGIHSEYFEILHKYGFIGLGLFLTLMGAMAWKALRLSLLRQALPSAMGFAVLLSLVNHLVASVTSGYVIREHTAVYFLLLIVILERFGPAIASRRARPAARAEAE